MNWPPPPLGVSPVRCVSRPPLRGAAAIASLRIASRCAARAARAAAAAAASRTVAGAPLVVASARETPRDSTPRDSQRRVSEKKMMRSQARFKSVVGERAAEEGGPMGEAWWE